MGKRLTTEEYWENVWDEVEFPIISNPGYIKWQWYRQYEKIQKMNISTFSKRKDNT